MIAWQGPQRGSDSQKEQGWRIKQLRRRFGGETMMKVVHGLGTGNGRNRRKRSVIAWFPCTDLPKLVACQWWHSMRIEGSIAFSLVEILANYIDFHPFCPQLTGLGCWLGMTRSSWPAKSRILLIFLFEEEKEGNLLHYDYWSSHSWKKYTIHHLNWENFLIANQGISIHWVLNV